MSQGCRWLLIIVAASILCSCRAAGPGPLVLDTNDHAQLSVLRQLSVNETAAGEEHASDTEGKSSPISSDAPEAETSVANTSSESSAATRDSSNRTVFVQLSDQPLSVAQQTAEAAVDRPPRTAHSAEETSGLARDGMTNHGDVSYDEANVGEVRTSDIGSDAILQTVPWGEHSVEPCVDGCPEGSPPPCWGDMQSLPCPSPALLQWYPDEYICDGGDGGIQVRVEDNWTVHHLEPEDTVGHFDTLDGRVLVTESNRICIYAPRFAAIRKVTGPLQNESRRHVAEAGLPDSALTERATAGSVNLTQRLAARRHLLVQPALALRDPLPAVELDNAEGLVQAIKNLSAHEDFRVIRWGVHKQAEKPLLAEFTQAAIAWSHDSAVQVLLERQEAIAEVTIQDVETTYQLDQPGTPRLRVIKTASTGDALPGEIVEFTIRFDSIGHQVIGNVTIMDSLTTRLEYVADSAQCSRPAHFASEENESGSLVLRWELDAPMEPGEGGIIRFRCRVR